MRSHGLQHKSNSPALCWEAILFFALYIIAPSYLAVEFHASIPLITLSRGLLVLLGLMLVIRRRNDLFNLRNFHIKDLNFGLTSNKFLRLGLLLYFLLLLVADVALLPADTAEALKAIFVVVAEQYVLVWLLTLILDTREKLVCALKVLVITSAVTALLCALGCILDINFFHFLNTVEREMLMTTYYRLGVLRAEAGFGHPVFYGAFCAIMVPIHMYFVENSAGRKQKLFYSACLTMTLVGLVLSNSRGSLLAFCCLVFLAAVLSIIQKRFKKFLCTYLPIGFSALGVLLVIALLLPAGIAYLLGIIDSLLDTVIPNNKLLDEVIQEATPGGDGPALEYGENAAGTRSRLVQLTGILWTLARKPIFGFGSNAHMRGLIRFRFSNGEWWPTKTFDIAIVSIICQYGIVGFVGFVSLYGSLLKTMLSKKHRQDTLMGFLLLSFITYMLCLLSISSLPKMAWVLIAAIVCLVNIREKEEG